MKTFKNFLVEAVEIPDFGEVLNSAEFADNINVERAPGFSGSDYRMGFTKRGSVLKFYTLKINILDKSYQHVLITDLPILEYRETPPQIMHNTIMHPTNRIEEMHDIYNTNSLIVVQTLHINGAIGASRYVPPLKKLGGTMMDNKLILDGIREWINTKPTFFLTKQMFKEMRTRESRVWERNNYIVLDLEHKAGGERIETRGGGALLGHYNSINNFRDENNLIEVELPASNTLKYKLFKKRTAPDPDIPSLFDSDRIVDDRIRPVDGRGSQRVGTSHADIDVSSVKGAETKSIDQVIADITQALEDE